jgi:hypothetical protein
MKIFTVKKVFLLILLISLIYACGYKEGVIRKGEKSYLLFTGNTANISLSIDNSEPFLLKIKNNNSDAPQKLYQVSPGKHLLKIYRDRILIVDRVIFLGNQETMEVHVP